VIAEFDRDRGFSPSLCGSTDESGDHHERLFSPVSDRLDREPQHIFVKPGFADCELGRMDANGEAAGTGVDIIAAERSLPTGIETAA
jgi:hypothetical protein